MSRKRVYDHNESNDEQPSTAVVVIAAAETSKAAGATVELESTRRMSLRTKKAAKYSEMDEEVVANSSSSSMSETGVNKALASPATTSNSNLENGAEKRAAAESIEKATAKTPKSTSKSTNMASNGNHVNVGRAQVKPVTKAKMKKSAEPFEVKVEKINKKVGDKENEDMEEEEDNGKRLRRSVYK